MWIHDKRMILSLFHAPVAPLGQAHICADSTPDRPDAAATAHRSGPPPAHAHSGRTAFLQDSRGHVTRLHFSPTEDLVTVTIPDGSRRRMLLGLPDPARHGQPDKQLRRN